MICLFLANGFEEIEALTPLDVLRRAGCEVRTVGIGGQTVTGAHGIRVLADVTDAELKNTPFEMVILPGGMPGASNLDASETVRTALAATAKDGGFLAAICAAPMVLGHGGYLAGKRATCYPGFEKELTGATVVRDARGGNVVRDGKVITAAGMGVALDFSLSLVTALKGQDVADRLRAGLMAPPRD